MGVGGTWFAASLLPLTGSGPLSRSSSTDVVRLMRVGVLDAVVAPWLAILLLLLPFSGLVLIAVSWLPGSFAAALRMVVLAGGTLAAGAVVAATTALAPSWGAGVYAIAVSLPVSVAALLVRTRRSHRPRSDHIAPHTPHV